MKPPYTLALTIFSVFLFVFLLTIRLASIIGYAKNNDLYLDITCRSCYKKVVYISEIAQYETRLEIMQTKLNEHMVHNQHN